MYLILQDQYQEGNFGDCERYESLVHGVFTNKEKAIEIAKQIPVITFEAQFGEGVEDVYVYKVPSNVKLENIEKYDIVYSTEKF